MGAMAFPAKRNRAHGALLQPFGDQVRQRVGSSPFGAGPGARGWRRRRDGNALHGDALDEKLTGLPGRPTSFKPAQAQARKSARQGKRVYVRVDNGGVSMHSKQT